MKHNVRFPEDRNAPQLQISRNQKKKWYKLTANHLSIAVAVLSLVVSIYSFTIAVKTLDESRKQYDENNISSDKQFARLTALLGTYQKTGNYLLENSRLQLQSSKDLIQQTASLGQPIILIQKVNWQQTPNPGKFSYQSVISISVQNKGFRPLKITNGSLFIINKINGVLSTQYLLSSPEVVSDNTAILLFPIKASKTQGGINNYVYFNITYKDLFTGSTLNVDYYYGFTNLNQDYQDNYDPYETYSNFESTPLEETLTVDLLHEEIQNIKAWVVEFKKSKGNKN